MSVLLDGRLDDFLVLELPRIKGSCRGLQIATYLLRKVKVETGLALGLEFDIVQVIA